MEEPHTISVFEWSNPAPGSTVPSPILFQGANVHIVLALIDENIESDPEWSEYVRATASRCSDDTVEESQKFLRFIPVAMSPKSNTLATGLGTQALGWYTWQEESRSRLNRLVREITYAATRLLRAIVDQNFDIANQMQPVKVFLSHSKHDSAGQRIAMRIRNWLSEDVQLATFIDIFDLPTGLPPEEMLEESIRQSVVLAIHSDSFSSREWCRREVLLAKEVRRPMVVVDCIDQYDERTYAYLGNVPHIRLYPRNPRRIEPIVQLLLDETFKYFLWHARTAEYASTNPKIEFIASPPELVTLATASRSKTVPTHIVYPDPPVDMGEAELLNVFGPHVQTLGQWLLESQA